MASFFAIAMLLLATLVIPASILYVRSTRGPNAFMYAGACVGVCAFQLGCLFLMPSATRFDPVLLSSIIHLVGGIGCAFLGLRQLGSRRVRTTQIIRRLKTR